MKLPDHLPKQMTSSTNDSSNAATADVEVLNGCISFCFDDHDFNTPNM